MNLSYAHDTVAIRVLQTVLQGPEQLHRNKTKLNKVCTCRVSAAFMLIWQSIFNKNIWMPSRFLKGCCKKYDHRVMKVLHGFLKHRFPNKLCQTNFFKQLFTSTTFQTMSQAPLSHYLKHYAEQRNRHYL